MKGIKKLILLAGDSSLFPNSENVDHDSSDSLTPRKHEQKRLKEYQLINISNDTTGYQDSLSENISPVKIIKSSHHQSNGEKQKHFKQVNSNNENWYKRSK